MALPNLEALLEEKKLPGLDGFRMVAVMAVVLAHSGVGTLFFSARHGWLLRSEWVFDYLAPAKGTCKNRNRFLQKVLHATVSSHLPGLLRLLAGIDFVGFVPR